MVVLFTELSNAKYGAKFRGRPSLILDVLFVFPWRTLKWRRIWTRIRDFGRAQQADDAWLEGTVGNGIRAWRQKRAGMKAEPWRSYSSKRRQDTSEHPFTCVLGDRSCHRDFAYVTSFNRHSSWDKTYQRSRNFCRKCIPTPSWRESKLALAHIFCKDQGSR